MRSLHSYVVQIQDVCHKCRIFHGFEENYLETIQPTWCALPYQALRAYKMVCAADTAHTLPKIDTAITWEALRMMAPRWKLAGKSHVASQNFLLLSNTVHSEKCLNLLEQL